MIAGVIQKENEYEITIMSKVISPKTVQPKIAIIKYISDRENVRHRIIYIYIYIYMYIYIYLKHKFDKGMHELNKYKKKTSY